MTQPSVLARLRATGVIAVLRAPSESAALRTVEALIAGGVTGVEITYSTPGALEVIAEVARRHGDGVYLGAGTVLTAAQADDAVAAGARYLVSPGTEPGLATAMLATTVPVFLGALTPSEVMAATTLGAHAVKIFPASLGGPAYLRSLRGPFPDLPMMPTGGVNAGNIAAWVNAGAVAVGAGSDLCSGSAMQAGRWDEIEANARDFSAAWAQATTTGGV